MKSQNLKIMYGTAFTVLLLIEVVIALFIHDNFVRPYIGDVLVVAVLYCFIRIFLPNKIRLMPLFIFLFASMVEWLQYFQLVKTLGLESNTFLRIIIGSTFDWMDIICYGIGCAILFVLEEIRREKVKSNQ